MSTAERILTLMTIYYVYDIITCCLQVLLQSPPTATYEYIGDMSYVGDKEDIAEYEIMQQQTKIGELPGENVDMDDDAELHALFDNINISNCDILNKSQCQSIDIEDQRVLMEHIGNNVATDPEILDRVQSDAALVKTPNRLRQPKLEFSPILKPKSCFAGGHSVVQKETLQKRLKANSEKPYRRTTTMFKRFEQPVTSSEMKDSLLPQSNIEMTQNFVPGTHSNSVMDRNAVEAAMRAAVTTLSELQKIAHRSMKEAVDQDSESTPVQRQLFTSGESTEYRNDPFSATNSLTTSRFCSKRHNHFVNVSNKRPTSRPLCDAVARFCDLGINSIDALEDATSTIEVYMKTETRNDSVISCSRFDSFIRSKLLDGHEQSIMRA